MKPVMIHEDGTDCGHEGTPQATITDEGGPRCAGGQLVTHVRFNGNVMTVEEAAHALKNIADTFTKLLTPLITSFVKLTADIGAAMDPAIRILAAASEAYDEEVELEEDGEEAAPDQFTMRFAEGMGREPV